MNKVFRFVVLLCAMLVSVSAQAQNLQSAMRNGGARSFSKSWPRTVYGPQSIKLKRVQLLTKTQPLIYESANYRFILDSKAEPKVVKRFAVLFEATYKYVLALPLNASAHYRPKDKKFPIYLFRDFASYYRAGGPQGSAGVYMPRTGVIMVPMPVLGVRWAAGKWKSVKKDNNSVLSHELVHQLTDGVRFTSWYLEGSAEYVAATRYTHGAYHGGSSTKQRAFQYVRSKQGLKDGSGRRLGPRFNLMSLERYMNLPYSQFTGSEGNKNYAVGLLLTQYFYHKHGRGDAAGIKNYIKAIQQGSSEREAQKHLLAGKTYAQLQEDFRRFCGQGGISIKFEK